MLVRTALVLCALAIAPSFAQEAAELALPRFEPREFRARREALAAAIGKQYPGEAAIVIVRGGNRQPDMGAFVQDQDFLYLAGVGEPGLALLLAVDGDGKLARDELLVPPHSPMTAMWDGSFLAPGEQTATRTGFSTAGNVRSLATTAQAALAANASGARPRLFTLLQAAARIGSTPNKAREIANEIAKDALDGRVSREAQFVAVLKQRIDDLDVQPLDALLAAMRPRKSEAELAVIGRCARIAAAGIAAAMQSCEPGQYEYQVAAVARFTFSRLGAGPDAYAAIVGGGPNGCVLHYNACQRQLLASDLIVMDYAPTLQGYATDVTRTFPASGKFTPEQRKLVQDVYDIQRALIADVKPGAKLSDLDRKCTRLLVERGYKRDHGPCHHVGLAVHDPNPDVLEAGMVITVEPGAYLRDQGMGCRIEDTIQVTTNGCEVLSKDVPSTPDAIEALMAKRPAR